MIMRCINFAYIPTIPELREESFQIKHFCSQNGIPDYERGYCTMCQVKFTHMVSLVLNKLYTSSTDEENNET